MRLCHALAAAGFILLGAAQAWPQERQNPLRLVHGKDGEPVVVHEGKAYYYHDKFHGRLTASGERFSQHRLTAASLELPLGTRVTVTNKRNGRRVEVVINDRGPYVAGRVIDLSREAAEALDMIEDGVTKVRVEVRPRRQASARVRDQIADKLNQTTEVAAIADEVPR